MALATEHDTPREHKATGSLNIIFLLSHLRNSATYVRAANLATQLAARGNEVTLVAPSPDSHFRSVSSATSGVTLVETPCFGHYPLGGFTTRLYLDPGGGPLDTAARLKMLLSDRYDIVQLFDHSPNVALPFYLLRNRIRARFVSDWCDIYHCDGGLRDHNCFRLDPLYRLAGSPFRAYSRFVEHDLRRKVDAVAAISTGLRDYAVASGVSPDRVFLLEGGADVDGIKPLSRNAARLRLGMPAQGKIVGFLGTFQRDLDIVIRSFVLIRQAVPDVRLLVIGSPHEETRRRVREEGLSDAYIEAGRCSDDMLSWYLAAANVFALPLRDNPANATRWPNKIGEYMAAGRPTVVNNVGDIADVVKKYKIGLVADQGAIPFAAQLARLLLDEPLAEEMGKNAREAACTRYSWALLAGELENRYRMLLMQEAVEKQLAERHSQG